MKILNITLAIALADHALGKPNQNELMQIADYMAAHPASRVFYARALAEMGIDANDIPGEAWAAQVPTEAQGAADMKAAISYVNEHWHKGKLHRFVAVRKLAWAAASLGRALDRDMGVDVANVVHNNGGSTAGLFRTFVNPATRKEIQTAAPSSIPATTTASENQA